MLLICLMLPAVLPILTFADSGAWSMKCGNTAVGVSIEPYRCNLRRCKQRWRGKPNGFAPTCEIFYGSGRNARHGVGQLTAGGVYCEKDNKPFYLHLCGITGRYGSDGV